MIRVGIVGVGHIAEDYISMFSKGLIRDARLSALTSRNRGQSGKNQKGI